MPFTISEIDAAAANAAITARNAARAAYEAQGSPTQKDLFAQAELMPLITSAAPMAVGFGNTLYDEMLANAKAAIEPFVSSTVERDALAHILSGPKTLLGEVNGLAHGAAALASEAPGNARLVVSILTKCLAAGA